MKKNFLCALLSLAMIFAMIPVTFSGFAAPSNSLSDTFPDAEAYSVPIAVSDTSKMGIFTPRVDSQAVADGAPIIFSHTKTAGPDESISITGANITEDTRFVVYYQRSSSASMYVDAKIQNLVAPGSAVITLPGIAENFSSRSIYAIWAINSKGASRPMLINKPEAWWVGPNISSPGETASVIGINLSSTNKLNGRAYVYIENADGSYGSFALATLVGPDKIDFIVPENIPIVDSNGDGVGDSTQYSVWVHTGYGNKYGWARNYFNVQPKHVWNSTIINVKDYGANGNGVSDDTAAINAAIAATDTNGDGKSGDNNNLYFPSGIYNVKETISVPGHLRVYGDGKSVTIIKGVDNYENTVVFSMPNQNYLEFADLTIDCYYDEPSINYDKVDYSYWENRGAVYIANNQFLWFKNVKIDSPRYGLAFKGFFGLSGSHIFFDGCDITTARQGVGANNIFFRNSSLYGQAVAPRTDTEMILDPWGSNCMYISGCYVADKNSNDDSKNMEFAKRFYRDNCVFSSGYNVYISDNNIQGIGPHSNTTDNNSGEIILFESANGKKMGNPISATESTVQFNEGITMPNRPIYTLQWSGEVFITSGKGVGQRRNVWCDDTQANSKQPILSLSSDTWDVIPDSTSSVALTVGARYVNINRNTISGIDDYDTRNTASTAVNAFESVHDMVIRDNKISKVGSGVTLFTIWEQGNDYKNTAFIALLQDNIVTDNQISEARKGIFLASVDYNSGRNGDDGLYHYIMYGNVFRNNTIMNVTEAAVGYYGDCFDDPYNNVFEKNICTNIPQGININGGPIAIVDRAFGSVFYKNKFSAGTYDNPTAFLDFSNSRPTSKYTGFNFSQNTIIGFDKVQSETKLGAKLQMPIRYFDLMGNTAQIISLPISNAGLEELSFTVEAVNSPWITAPVGSLTVPSQISPSNIEITCDPSNLPMGLTKGTLSVSDGKDTFIVYVSFNKVATGDLVTWDDIKGTNTAADAVTSKLNLISSTDKAADATVVWSSSDEKTIDNMGNIYRPATIDKAVVLTATVKSGTATQSYTFETKVTAFGRELITWDDIKGGNDYQTKVTGKLNLPTELSEENATVTWSSSAPLTISENGTVVRNPYENKMVTLTAKIAKGGENITQSFRVTVLQGEKITVHKGDANVDGNITIIDALAIFKHISGKVVLVDGTAAKLNADVDGNGNITILDALCIFKHISGKQPII